MKKKSHASKRSSEAHKAASVRADNAAKPASAKDAGAAAKRAEMAARIAKAAAEAALKKAKADEKSAREAEKKEAREEAMRKAEEKKAEAEREKAAAKKEAAQRKEEAEQEETKRQKLEASSHEIEDGRVNRVATGLPGLDKVLQGGIPRESIILLSGACGTGKSTFAMQFLYYGAKYCNEPGVYITLEEDPKKLTENMSLFGWDLQKLIDRKKLIVIKPDVYKFDSIKQIIGDAIDKIGAKRLVVDSYSVLLTYFSDPYEIRNGLVQLDREIKKMNCTAMVISDIKDNSEIFSTTGVEEFIVDGVIVVYLIKNPAHPYQSTRAISVRKMRATQHPLNLYPFEIGARGVSVAGQGIAGDGGQGEHHGQHRAQKGGAKPRPEHREPERKEQKQQKKSDSMVDISSLKRKGGHTWKWRHL